MRNKVLQRINPFRKSEQDWGKFFKKSADESRKDRLIRFCKKYDVSIHIDDSTEPSKGAYAVLRSVVSEAELERRLNTKKALVQAQYSNYISLFALLASIGSLVLHWWP